MSVNWIEPLKFVKQSWDWIGLVEFQGSTVEVASKWADKRLSRILACIVPVTKEAAHQLTELYNDEWIEDRALSVTAVKRRIELNSIDLDRENKWAMWFTDDDLFGGHWIRVNIDVSGEVTLELYG
jgi:hypothetical protein